MKTFISKILTLTLGSSLLFFTACQREFNPNQEANEIVNESNRAEIKGTYIIQLKDEFAPCTKSFKQTFTDREAKRQFSENNEKLVNAKLQEIYDMHSIKPEQVIRTYAHAISGFAASLTEAQVMRLKKDVNIASMEKDFMIALEDTKPQEDNEMRAQTTPCGITNAGGSADGSTKGTWIWIVDTGIDLTHPDLNVQASSPWAKTVVGGTPNDCHGHGTHCAGIAAAKNNTIGVIGVSAGAKVVPVRVFSACVSPTSPSSTIISGIDHVAAYDIAGDVVNLSVGGYYGSGCSTSSPYKTSIVNISNGGTWVAIAAGNESANAANYQPACINNAKVYTVAAMTCGKVFASSYSNYETAASGPIDYIATGSSVYSTYKNGSYGTMTGTSMATPHVAGVLHQRNAAPLSGGTVAYSGVNYTIAKR